jgi:hypothetical protein
MNTSAGPTKPEPKGLSAFLVLAFTPGPLRGRLKMLPECMGAADTEQALLRHALASRPVPPGDSRPASKFPSRPLCRTGPSDGQGEDDCAGGDRALGRGLHERARRADHDGQVRRLVLGAEAGAHHSGMRTVTVTLCLPAGGLARR